MNRLGAYTCTVKIHESQFHEFHRGLRASDGVPVVVKAVRGEYPPAFALARLRHEYHLLTMLDSSRTVRCLGLEKWGNGLALVLEDLGDISLKKVLRCQRRQFLDSLRIAVDLAKAVASVHEKGVLHKAIRPEHFLVSSPDARSITLIDFSAATNLTQEPQALDGTTDFDDSLRYIAPEQTGRMSRVVDRRSDLYSLGAVLYELFAGRPMFDAVDPLELVHCHLTRVPLAPARLVPDMPPVLSDVILKLLRKVAEERYQSAHGLQHDLEQILERVMLRKSAVPFLLGVRDVTGELNLSQKLYGRERELRGLVGALKRVQSGQRGLFLVAGPSGIGKSALVQELRRHIGSADHFVSGKFDHLKRSVPYSAVAGACRELVQVALAQPPQSLAETRERLLRAMGVNAQVMTSMIPELELIIGPQPPVPDLGPLETQSRFESTFQQFLGAFTPGRRALVLYLDDLQWADTASLRLIEATLAGTTCGKLLVVGAYRNNEVDATHPLTLLRADLVKRGIVADDLVLGPLEVEHVTQLLADALSSPSSQLNALARVLVEKTDGNPFFLGQLLTTLVRNQVLSFDTHQSAWKWDLARAKATLATSNVVELLLEKLRQLPDAAQEVIRFASCIGHEFDSKTLVQVAVKDRRELAQHLWRALSDGLIVPIDENYRFSAHPFDDCDAGILNARFRFLHDRVTQAAYSLLSDAERTAAHLTIGRLLRDQTGAVEADDLFQVTSHLNRGSSLIAAREERRQLAELNLAAARRARAGAAAESAIHYLAHARALLGDESWNQHYALAFDVHMLQAECEQLLGRGELALEILEQAERNARTILDRVTARNLRSVILTNLSRLRSAVHTSLETMEILGERLPEPDDLSQLGVAIGAAFEAYQTDRDSRSIASLAQLPLMTDPMQLALMDTYAKTIPAAFQFVHELMVLVVLKATHLSMRSGTAPITPFMYTQYGLVHSIITGDYDVAYQFGELGIEMARRNANPAMEVQPRFIFGGFLSHWRRPISESLEHLRTGLRFGLESGDAAYTGYFAGFLANYRLYSGERLEDIQASLPEYFDLVNRSNDGINRGLLTIARQTILALRGETESAASLNSGGFSESAFETQHVPSVRAFLGAAKAFLGMISGDLLGAFDATERFKPLPSVLYNAEYKLAHALGLAHRARSADSEQRAELLKLLRADIIVLETWASNCPNNHAHRAKLAGAELAELEQRPLDAMEEYDAAIELARKNGFLQYQALACELGAAFYLRRGNRRAARSYLEEARYAYAYWGATAKASVILADHRDLLQPGHLELIPAATRYCDEQDQISRNAAGQLDLAAAIRTTEAIATELASARLLERLMQTLVESAGAQRGFLVLRRDLDFRVVASIATDPLMVQVGLDQELGTCRELPESLVLYVVRTSTPLVINDASAELRFRSDPYIATRNPKSVLCIPMFHRGRLTGVLYLENNSSTHAFSLERLRLMQFLAAQSAAALENARLYGDLSQVTEQLRTTNENLERQVAERTSELRATLVDLWSEMDLAKKIQTVLLPESQRVREYDFAAKMIPAEVVGGDYYDIIETEDRVWVVIGDVSGHGIAAGLIMMMIQTAIRTLVCATGGLGRRTPAEVLVRANQAVQNNLRKVGKGQYMTITLLEMAGSVVTFAGLHQDLLVHRAGTGAVERIETHGLWVGILDDVSGLLRDDTVHLEPGDTLLLYSDGVTERKVGAALLGTDGLAASFKSAASEQAHPNTILQRLIGDLSGQRLTDDATLMAVSYNPRPAIRPPDPTGTIQHVAKTCAFRPQADLSVQAQIEPLWATVRQIRYKLHAVLEAYPEEVRYAAGMVATELLENAIKYGDSSAAAHPQIHFSFTLRQGICRISVTNGASSDEHFHRLKACIDEVSATKDKAALYMQRLHELLDRPSPETGLGIYRIGYEGEFELEGHGQAGVVTVTATRSVQ